MQENSVKDVDFMGRISASIDFRINRYPIIISLFDFIMNTYAIRIFQLVELEAFSEQCSWQARSLNDNIVFHDEATFVF